MNESTINVSPTFKFSLSQTQSLSLLQNKLLSVNSPTSTRFDQVLSDHQSAISLDGEDTSSSNIALNSKVTESEVNKNEYSSATDEKVKSDKIPVQNDSAKVQSNNDSSIENEQTNTKIKVTKLASDDTQSGHNLPVKEASDKELKKQEAIKKEKAEQANTKKSSEDDKPDNTNPATVGVVPVAPNGIDPHKLSGNKVKLSQDSYSGKSPSVKKLAENHSQASQQNDKNQKSVNAQNLPNTQQSQKKLDVQPSSGQFVLGQTTPQNSTTSVNVAGNNTKAIKGQKSVPVMNQLKTGQPSILKSGVKPDGVAQGNMLKTLTGEKGNVLDHADHADQAIQAHIKPLDGGSKGTNALLKGYATSVNVPVGQPGWSEGVSNKVVWLTKHQFQLAEIHLDPPELGPVDIKIKMHHDQASITFNSPHAHIRDLLENSMPKLREMMAQNGVALGDVDVSSQQNSQGQSFSMGGDSSGSGSSGQGGSLRGQGNGTASEIETPVHMSSISIDRMVDYYA
jgi:flagellar hook-length control protein FliK